MSWLASNRKTLRAETERALELKIVQFMERNPTWKREGVIKHTPARLPGFKAWSIVMVEDV